MRKRGYALVAALGLAGIVVGRAAIAFSGGPSICFLPPGVVSPEERYREIARHFRANPNIQHPGLSRLDPRRCCSMAGNYSAEEPVKFWTTLTGRQSHIVQTNVRGPAGNMLTVSTDLCGKVITHRGD